MAKESVIVFDGEDKFIAKKNKQYNKFTGYGNYVGAEGEASLGAQPNTTSSTTADGAIFNQYIASQNASVVIPNATDVDFCQKAQEFLRTNGNGLATPDQIMGVYNQFQATCVRPQQEEQNSFTEPDWNSLSCDEIQAKINSINDLLSVSRLLPELRASYENALANGNRVKVEKCGITPPTLPDTPPTNPTPVLSGVSLTNLGVPPKSGGAQGGGGGEKEEEKKSNLWIWLVVAAGLVILFSKDNK